MHIAMIRSVQNRKTYHSKFIRPPSVIPMARSGRRPAPTSSTTPTNTTDLLRGISPIALSLTPPTRLGPTLLLPAFHHCALVAPPHTHPPAPFQAATARWWRATTLPNHSDLEQAAAENLYAAIDWALQRQPRIQGKLGRSQLAIGGLGLLDISSS